MRVGLIARAEDRGLGIQTWEFSRHLDCSVLLVDHADRATIPMHYDRYPVATLARHRGSAFMERHKVRRWVESVDVVYSAETFYDPQFTNYCARFGAKAILHVNPEFYREGPKPSAWWAPTSWRLRHLPGPTEVVTYPVASERFTPATPHDGPTRWLHVGGRPAMCDRNGTQALLEALPLLREPCHVTFATQDLTSVVIPDLPPWVTAEVVGPSVGYWEMYGGHDALVMPRRYGGLCLPVQEAMAAGLAVLMPDWEPNPQTWPVASFSVAGSHVERMYAGDVDVAHIAAHSVAVAMDELADPGVRRRFQARSLGWAAENSWEAQAPLWMDRFKALL